MKPPVERQQGASFDLHRFAALQSHLRAFLDVTSVTLDAFP